MASTIRSGFSLPPPHLLLFEILTASAAVGCTPSGSWLRIATLPVLSACSYSIIKNGALHMRPRWASLLGGFSVAVLFRYLEIGLISRWNFENQGPITTPQLKKTKPGAPTTSNPTFLQRLQYGWNTLWSFRQVNTPFEVKNVPRFSSSDPPYVPSWGKFVLQQALSTVTCYSTCSASDRHPQTSHSSIPAVSLCSRASPASQCQRPNSEPSLSSASGPRSSS